MTRKTDEIKIRVTPEEKSSWQEAAEFEEVGLSQLIRTVMNGQIMRLTSQTVPIEPVLTPAAIEALRGHYDPPAAVSGWNTPPPEYVPTSVEPAALSEDPVLDSLSDGSFLKTVPKRRTEECHCGKPTWIYCGECGS